MGDFGPREEYGRIRERSYRRGGWDRERRLRTTIAVGAALLFLLGVGLGYWLGRATAPKPVASVEPASTAAAETSLPAGVIEEVPTETLDSALGADEDSASLETTADTKRPPKPKQLAPANGAVLTTSRVTLRWTKVKDDVGPVTYSFEIQNRRSNGTYGNTQIIKGLKTTSYSARVLQVRRRWRVWAVDAAGNKSAIEPVVDIHPQVRPALQVLHADVEQGDHVVRPIPSGPRAHGHILSAVRSTSGSAREPATTTT